MTEIVEIKETVFSIPITADRKYEIFLSLDENGVIIGKIMNNVDGSSIEKSNVKISSLDDLGIFFGLASTYRVFGAK